MNSDIPPSALEQLLQGLAAGRESVATVTRALIGLGVEALLSPQHSDEGVQLDLHRQQRCGYPEVIYGPGKTPAAIVDAFQKLHANEQPCLATRVDAEQTAALLEAFPEAIANTVAKTVRWQSAAPTNGRVLVVSAGTSDRPVAEEAVETLRWMNVDVELILDVGVAGPHRLLAQREKLATADAIVVVAGMEGALPSVVGGWVRVPVLAVPTSVGYGAAFGGVAALLGMLNSCAANVAVVNIDAGFKAAYLAGMIAQKSTATAD